jgi:hypothetical protein
MKRFVRKAVSLAAAGVAAVGVAVVPAASAHADPFPCPRVSGVCTWTLPGGEGQLGLLFGSEYEIAPPVWSAQNQTPVPWCFYRFPGFNGPRREIQSMETVGDIGFPAFSAKPGPCETLE